MRRLAPLLLACLLLLSACGRVVPDPIPETTKITTEQPTTEQPEEEQLWADSCIHESFIYYAMYDGSITRAPVNDPNNMEIVVTQAQIEALPPPTGGDGYSLLGQIEIYGDFLVGKDSGISNIAYNLKTGEVFRLLEDFSSMAIWNDTVYYVEHAHRSFSLYCKPLKPNAQRELLLGKGSTWYRGESTPEEFASFPWVRSVYVEDNRLFFIQSNDELWEFKEDGKHVRVE